MPKAITTKIINGFSLVLVALAYGVGLITSNADPDLWGYLSFGYLFWTQPGFPFQDPFSYMPTNELWIYHEWLTGVIFFPLYGAFGEVGLQVLRYGAALGALWFAFATALKRGAPFAFATLGLFLPVFAISAGYAPVRAQVFTFLFFSVTLYLCEECRIRQSFRRLWFIPPVVLLWCNLHGGFVSGLAIIGLFALGEALSRRQFLPYLMILFACLLLTLINPYGLDYWPYLINAITMPRPEITEWMSLLQAYKVGYKQLSTPLYLGMLPLCIVFCVWPLKRDWTAVLVLAAIAWMGFSHVRHLPFMGLAMAALLPSGVFVLLGEASKGRMVRKILVMAAFCIPILYLCVVNGTVAYQRMKNPGFLRVPLSLEVLSPNQVLEGQISYPVGGITFLKENNLSGNILTEFDWGQFVMWALPESKVAMDGRYETVYPDHICREFFAFTYGRPGGEGYLGKYPHEIALVNANSIARIELARAPGWDLVYEGDGCVVFIKKGLEKTYPLRTSLPLGASHLSPPLKP